MAFRWWVATGLGLDAGLDPDPDIDYSMGKDIFCVNALCPRKLVFSHVETFSCLPGLNLYKAEDKMSCSWTYHSASGESLTSDHSTPSLTLNQMSHCTPRGNERSLFLRMNGCACTIVCYHLF